jgi:hypothetical protein
MALKPTVWIDGTRWPDTIAANTPALAGARFSWGYDDDRSMDRRERLTLQLLQRTTDAPNVDLGQIVALTLSDPYLSVFVGRIVDVEATPAAAYPLAGDDAEPVPALRYTITATDVLDELQNLEYATAPTYVPAENGLEREARIGGWILYNAPGGWTKVHMSSSLRAVPMVELHNGYRKPALEVLYDTLRASGRRVRPTVTRSESTGNVYRRLTFVDDPVQARAVTYRLHTFADGTWSLSATPGNGIVAQLIPSAWVDHRALSWSKRREDMVTDVEVQTWRANPDHVTAPVEVPVLASTYLSLGPIQARLGKTVAKVNTALNEATYSINALTQIAAPYLPPNPTTNPAGSLPWSTRRLTLVGKLMDEANTRLLLDPSSRVGVALTVTGHIVNAPAGANRPRGIVIGAEATWDGQRWNITADLSRQPQPAPASSWWTCERVAASTNPLIKNATCESVGPALSFADFAWIGEPA